MRPLDAADPRITRAGGLRGRGRERGSGNAAGSDPTVELTTSAAAGPTCSEPTDAVSEVGRRPRDRANHQRVARSMRTLACPATSSKRAFVSAGPYRLRAFGTWRIPPHT